MLHTLPRHHSQPMAEPVAKRLKQSHPHVPAPCRLINPTMRLAYAKTALSHVSDDILEMILRYTRPPVSVRRQIGTVMAEFRSVLKNVAWVRYHPSLPWHQQRRRIRTTAGQILFRTRRVPRGTGAIWHLTRHSTSSEAIGIKTVASGRETRAKISD
eukprot:COSAG01_NODE_4253_length_5208_cov_4.500000_2_plen_157_part_00